MAKIKYGQIIAQASGKIAGMVFSRNTFGQYIRTKVTPVNPSTNAQQLVRTRLAALSQAWRGITESQRLLFNETAINFTNIDVFGDNVPLTGFNLYLRLNRFLQEIGEARVDDAPQPATVDGFITLALTADTTVGTLEIAFTDAIPADQKTIVYATAPQSAGKTFVKSEFRIIDVLTTADLTPEDLAAAYIIKFGALPPAGSKVFVQLRPVLIASGQPGTIIQASDIAF